MGLCLPLALVALVVLTAYLTFRTSARRVEARRVSVTVRALHPAEEPASRRRHR